MRPTVGNGRERFREYRQRRADERAWSPVGLDSRTGVTVHTLPRRERRMRLRHRRRNPITLQSWLLLGLLAVGVLAGLIWAWQTTRVDVDITGIADGAAVPPERVEGVTVVLDVSPADRLDGGQLRFDDRDVLEDATIEDGRVEWMLPEVEEGEHSLHLEVPRPLLSDAAFTWSFTVDGTPPVITVPPYLPPHEPDEAVTVEGSVNEDVEVTVDGEPLELREGGSFTLEYDVPPPGPIEIEAVDAAGNRRITTVHVPLEFPDDIRGAHVTSAAWDTPSLREGILDLIDEGLVNTVVLSLKDEGGIVGHSSQVPLAREVGASRDLYDLREVVDLLHDKGVRVTGRIVAFRDPLLADAAWSRGDEHWVIQTPDGERYGLYGGGFTNFSHPEVQRYNIDLAMEAVDAGVDDILWDYVRRPDGLLDEMQIPGLDTDPEQVIVDFLAESHERVRAGGAVQGASVFGIAATRPEQIAQNVLGMAGNSDYIAPMLYPSHWNSGEYGLADPERDPYEIVKRSLRDFRQQVTRTGRPLVPWLQHFSLGVEYGIEDIRAQIQAAEDMGYSSWMMWDPAVTYNAEALRR